MLGFLSLTRDLYSTIDAFRYDVILAEKLALTQLCAALRSTATTVAAAEIDTDLRSDRRRLEEPPLAQVGGSSQQLEIAITLLAFVLPTAGVSTLAGSHLHASAGCIIDEEATFSFCTVSIANKCRNVY